MIDLKLKMQEAAALFRAIESEEVASHVGRAFQAAVEHGRDRMREAMPQVLGRDVKGPGGVTGRFGEPTQRTINAIQSSRMDWRSLRSLDQVNAKMFVQGQQGKVGQDQSAYLKFQFGDGPQVRRPGDVGMDKDAVRVPQGEALLLTQKVRINPYYVGGRQAPGILPKVKSRAAQDGGNFFESPREKLAKAMGQLAASTRAGSRPEQMTQAGFDANMKRLHAMSNLGKVHGKIAEHGFNHQGVLKGTQKYANSRKTGIWWSVFEKAGKNGVPTYFARPPRVRDPAGGTHAIRRANGKVGQMPNMLNLAYEYGESGPRVGPRLLFASLREAAYQPKLQAPWEQCIDAAIEHLDAAIERELDHALERRSQGRSY